MFDSRSPIATMVAVQMITFDRVGGKTVPVEVEVKDTDPSQTTSKHLIVAGAKKFKTVTKQSRAYHGLTGCELIGNVELESLSGAFIVLSGKGGWKGAAQISAAHENAKLASEVIEAWGGSAPNAPNSSEPSCSGEASGGYQIQRGTDSLTDMRDLVLDAARCERASGVVLFWKDTQDNGYLSNWGKSPILIDGVNYNCVEQWLMASKSRACGDQSILEQIMSTPNPRKQKGLGRLLDKKLVGRHWNAQQKWDAQLKGVMAKFQQHAALAVKLLRTGQKRIAEASPSDCIYGIGLSPSNPLAQDPANWSGMNLLGKALEHVRAQVRQHIMDGKDLASMPCQVAAESILVAQEVDEQSSEPESSSESEPDGPCILLVHNKQPFDDWAATLRSYLRTRFQVHVRSMSLNVQRLGLLERLELDNPANVIIPFGREVTELVCAREGSALLCSADLYYRLDHKGCMFSLEFPATISQIPTYVIPPTIDSAHTKLPEFRSFVSGYEAVIIKPAEEAGSKGQRIISRERVQDLLDKSHNGLCPLELADTVVQPYLENHITVEFNFFALEGELIEWLCTQATGGITEDMWTNGTRLKTYDGEELSRIVSFVRDTIRLHQLHGLMEFEFLILDGQVFLLEINPRISTSITGFDNQGFSPYIEKLVVPYLQSFGLLKEEKLSHWQAPCVFCPPEKHAAEFWRQTFRKCFAVKCEDANCA